MTIYTYNRDDLLELLEEAESIGNLSANLGLSYFTVQHLVKTEEAYPNRNTVNKIKPFALGFAKIKRIKRPYKKRDPSRQTEVSKDKRN